MNPVLLIISLSASITLAFMVEKPKPFYTSLLFFIVLFLIISLSNPLFSQNGDTILFYIFNIKVTLESLFYGIMISSMLVAVIYWFKSYNQIMTSDKFIFLFGRIVPSLALVITMGLKFIPNLKRQIIKISQAQKGIGLYSNKGLINKVKSGLRIISILITSALENSLDTSDSMKARGYGLKNRTSFSVFKFRKTDGVILAIIILLVLTITAAYGLNLLEFNYYPNLTNINTTFKGYITYSLIALLMFLPSIIEIKEKIKWHYFKSRI